MDSWTRSNTVLNKEGRMKTEHYVNLHLHVQFNILVMYVTEISLPFTVKLGKNSTSCVWMSILWPNMDSSKQWLRINYLMPQQKFKNSSAWLFYSLHFKLIDVLVFTKFIFLLWNEVLKYLFYNFVFYTYYIYYIFWNQKRNKYIFIKLTPDRYIFLE